MTDLRPRRFHTLIVGPGYFSAICEEGRAWHKRAGFTAWEELEPLPEIENHFAGDADFDPGAEKLRALADFIAQTGATPLFDGFDGPPAPPIPEAPPATAEPEFLTYDKFEDPLL
jgi:hypothetical protein